MPDLADRRDPLALAFLLPQFHPVPENDEWWGPGFTEWFNVTAARPRFPGHDQPRRPADLGFYDLRLAETLEAQAELAQTSGLTGFCWYHYWFNGRRILQSPLERMLASKLTFPFVLCWANENWTRAWDGSNSETLLRQSYSDSDDQQHIESLLPVFADPRYITVNGCPVFLVYRSGLLPDVRKTLDTWRRAAKKFGFPDLHLCRVDRHLDGRALPADAEGFDMAVAFSPSAIDMPNPLLLSRLRNLANRLPGMPMARQTVWAYHSVVAAQSAASERWPTYPCVAPGWDNSPRRRRGAVVLHGSTPDTYATWLRAACSRAVSRAPDVAPFVFINAWNEWAEGAYLEPDQRWGHAYLEATRSVIGSFAR